MVYSSPSMVPELLCTTLSAASNALFTMGLLLSHSVEELDNADAGDLKSKHSSKACLHIVMGSAIRVVLKMTACYHIAECLLSLPPMTLLFTGRFSIESSIFSIFGLFKNDESLIVA
jgi:hypothetical protein